MPLWARSSNSGSRGMPLLFGENASRYQSWSTDIAISATFSPRRERAAAKLAATWACASPVGVLTIIALGSRSVAIDIAARPRYASAANEFGSAITANSSASAGMIESTGAENVSAASSGSRIVRSARSTRSAAPSANTRPPNRPPSAGRVVAWLLGDPGGGRLRDHRREHLGVASTGSRSADALLRGVGERGKQLDPLEREVERADRSLLRHRRRTASRSSGQVAVRARRSGARRGTRSASACTSLASTRRSSECSFVTRLCRLRWVLRIFWRASALRALPNVDAQLRATVCAWIRVGAVTTSDSRSWVSFSFEAKPIPALGRRCEARSASSRMLTRRANFCGPDSAMFGGRGRGGRILLVRLLRRCPSRAWRRRVRSRCSGTARAPCGAFGRTRRSRPRRRSAG